MNKHTSAFVTRRRRTRLTALVSATALALGAAGAVRGYALSSTSPAPSRGGWLGYAKPTIIDSHYAIPAGAVFVAPGGSDASRGTIHAPFRTISRAIASTRAGGTVVVRGGTYRGSLGTIGKRVTIQAYPHEDVWLKGSVPVSGFRRSGGAWVKTGWTSTLCHNCYPHAAIDHAYPAAGLPDQVFFDGAPLRQVLSSAKLAPRTFSVDTKHHRLLVGSDPAGHTVEATNSSMAMQFNGASEGSKLLGIGVMQYGPHFDYNRDAAMVVVIAPNVTFERDTFAWSAARGLSVFRPGAVVEHSAFINNGANGLHANNADGLVVMQNHFLFSNQEHFSIAPSPTASIAAIKATSTRNAVVKWNYIDDNDSTGVWFDINADNVTISNNLIVRNAGYGVMYEISTRGLIAGNMIANNGREGVRISGSTNTKIWNNTLARNALAQLGVYDDRRTQGNRRLRGLGLTWDTAGITAYNNVIAAAQSTTQPLWISSDSNRPRRRTTLQMISGDGHNLFVRPTASADLPLASWQSTLHTTKQWDTLTALQAATVREQGSRTTDVMPSGDGVDAIDGMPLPPDVAAAISG